MLSSQRRTSAHGACTGTAAQHSAQARQQRKLAHALQLAGDEADLAGLGRDLLGQALDLLAQLLDALAQLRLLALAGGHAGGKQPALALDQVGDPRVGVAPRQELGREGDGGGPVALGLCTTRVRADSCSAGVLLCVST